MMRQRTKKIAALFLALCVMLGTMGSFSAFAAETTKMITITTDSDINPFIRFFMHNKLFSTGGPFTVKCEMNIQEFQKIKPNGCMFVDIMDGRDKTKSVITLNTWAKKTDGWVEMKTKEGQDITFNNIGKVLIDSKLQPYGLLNFGALYAKGVVSYRNFRILNAAGELVYSWDTDADFQKMKNLKENDNPEPLVMACTFGDGSGVYVVSDSEKGSSNVPTTPPTSDGPVYEDPNETAAPSTDETTQTSAISTTAATSVSTEAVSSTTVAASTSASTVPSEPTDTAPFPIWIPLVIVGGVLVLGGGVFLVLWKMKKLPWRKSE